MTKDVTKRVVDLLRVGDPMTITQISQALGCKHQSVWYACKAHPLIYIDHWVDSKAPVPQWVPMYSIIDEPGDTPKPKGKPVR